MPKKAQAKRLLQLEPSHSSTTNRYSVLRNSSENDESPSSRDQDNTSTSTPPPATPTKSSLRNSSSPPSNHTVRFSHGKRTHYSFLKVRLEVKANNEGATGVSEALGKLLTIIQDVDEEALLANYTGDMDHPEEGAIDSASSIPKSLTALKRFAYRVKSQKKGGTTWTNIKLLHNINIQEILQDTKDEFREESFGMYLQPIQHFNVKMIGWILYFHETIELQFWQEFFNTQLKMKGHEGDMVGLSVRKPLDGTKSNAGLETQKSVKTIHVETKGDISDSIKNDLKSILKGTAIKKFYHSELRLIPPYDFRQQTIHYNSKVKSCIVSHEQYTAQISMGDFDIDTVDRSLADQDNATMRELILRIKHSNGSPLFIGVEKKWNGQGYSVLYPTVFRNEAMEYVKHLPFYLVRLYGKDIKRQFSARIQHEINSTVWNKEEKRAFSAEDMDLKDAQSAHESMTWFTFDPSLSLNNVEQNLSSDTAFKDSLNDDDDQFRIEQRSEVS